MELDTLEYGLMNGWPKDAWRVKAVADLVERGYGSSLLFSQDVCLKVMRRAYGGFGYSNVLENGVPRLLNYGLTKEQIDEILVVNPHQVLTFTDPV